MKGVGKPNDNNSVQYMFYFFSGLRIWLSRGCRILWNFCSLGQVRKLVFWKHFSLMFCLRISQAALLPWWFSKTLERFLNFCKPQLRQLLDGFRMSINVEPLTFCFCITCFSLFLRCVDRSRCVEAYLGLHKITVRSVCVSVPLSRSWIVMKLQHLGNWISQHRKAFHQLGAVSRIPLWMQPSHL